MFRTSAALAMLSAFVFTNANAPTFQLWHDLPTAELASADLVDHSSDRAFGTLTFGTMNQELNEDDALERFEIDEWFLPHLNVDMPALFDWSDSDSTYLAFSLPPSIAARGGSHDNYGGAVIQLASLGGAGIATGGGGTRASSTTPIESSISETATPDETSTAATGKNTGDGETALPVEQPPEPTLVKPDPVIGPPTDETSLANAPVQVPAPGMFGLFVLGLAGLRLAGRKKNGSG